MWWQFLGFQGLLFIVRLVNLAFASEYDNVNIEISNRVHDYINGYLDLVVQGLNVYIDHQLSTPGGRNITAFNHSKDVTQAAFFAPLYIIPQMYKIYWL